MVSGGVEQRGGSRDTQSLDSRGSKGAKMMGIEDMFGGSEWWWQKIFVALRLIDAVCHYFALA